MWPPGLPVAPQPHKLGLTRGGEGGMWVVGMGPGHAGPPPPTARFGPFEAATSSAVRDLAASGFGSYACSFPPAPWTWPHGSAASPAEPDVQQACGVASLLALAGLPDATCPSGPTSGRAWGGRGVDAAPCLAPCLPVGNVLCGKGDPGPGSPHPGPTPSSPAGQFAPGQDGDAAHWGPTPTGTPTPSPSAGGAPGPPPAVLQCPACDFTTSRRWNMDKHKELHDAHPGAALVPCPHPACGKHYLSRKALYAHIDDAHGGVRVLEGDTGAGLLRCAQCDYVTSDRSRMKKHDARHLARPRAALVVCPVPDCGKRFMRRQALCFHLDTDHQIERGYRVGTEDGVLYCGSCDYTTRDRHNMNRHTADHSAHPDAPLQWCPHPGCGRRYLSWKGLYRHIGESHDGVRKPPSASASGRQPGSPTQGAAPLLAAPAAASPGSGCGSQGGPATGSGLGRRSHWGGAAQGGGGPGSPLGASPRLSGPCLPSPLPSPTPMDPLAGAGVLAVLELERADMPQAVAMARTEAGALERQGASGLGDRHRRVGLHVATGTMHPCASAGQVDGGALESAGSVSGSDSDSDFFHLDLASAQCLPPSSGAGVTVGAPSNGLSGCLQVAYAAGASLGDPLGYLAQVAAASGGARPGTTGSSYLMLQREGGGVEAAECVAAAPPSRRRSPAAATAGAKLSLTRAAGGSAAQASPGAHAAPVPGPGPSHHKRQRVAESEAWLQCPPSTG